MATTADGDVSVISHGATPVVLRYAFANGAATLKKTLNGLSNPAGVGISADDALVLIADGGDSQQIKAFNNATGNPAWTYGAHGVLAANEPAVTPENLNLNVQFANTTSFGDESFITFQPDNSFWIGDEGNSRVLHFSLQGGSSHCAANIPNRPPAFAISSACLL